MKISRFTWAAVSFGIAAAMFILTMEPTVGLIDSGELALACSEPGIAHPTGYPLYILIGRLFVLLSGLDPVLATNLLSAIAGGIAAAVLFAILDLLLGSLGNSNRSLTRAISIMVSLLFAASRTVWAASTITEVYALEIAIDLMALFCLLSWRAGERRSLFFLGAYLFGLSSGVHMMFVLFAPAVLLLIIFERRRIDLRMLLFGAVFFILGATAYLYLPIRAAQNPCANFGDPSSFERFFRHITAWQYRVWMFKRPAAELLTSLKSFAFQLAGEASVFAIPFALVGAVFMVIRKRRLFWICLAIFAFDVVYSLNYSIPDIESYYLPAIAIWLLWIGFGAAWIAEKLKWRFIAAIFLLPIIALPITRWREMDRSDYYLAEETAENLLALAPRDAIIYLNNWDWYAPAKYLQQARGYREDLILLDFELMRRSWYLEGLLEKYPQALGPARTEIKDFKTKVIKFERREEVSPSALETAWRRMHYAIARSALETRPVCGTFYTSEMANLFESAPKIGRGALLEIVVSERSISRIPTALYKLDEFRRLHDNLSWREKSMVSIYRGAWLARASNLHETGFIERSADYLELSLSFFPDHWNSYKNLAVIRIEQGRYEEAIDIFREGEPFIPPGSYPQMIYDDLERRIEERDSLSSMDDN